MTLRVLIADDHARMRAMISDVLTDAGIEVCAQAATAEGAVTSVIQHEPDVVLLDISMPGNGISAARRIAAQAPRVNILMLTVSANADDVLDALQAGARGYVLKGARPEEIIDAVEAVHAGAGVISPAVAPVVVNEIRRVRDRYVRTASGVAVQLTEREWTILESLESGETTSAIAASLYVAPVTIRSHIAALARKLEVRDRKGAVALFASQRPAEQPLV